MKGVNSRLDEIQAAFLLEKLNSLDGDNNRRKEIAKYYCSGIKNRDIDVNLFVDGPHVYHLYVTETDFRQALQQHLSSNGVETLIHYPVPPHQQPAYQELNTMRYPIAENIHKRVLSLPISPVMTDQDVSSLICACNVFDGAKIGLHTLTGR